MRCGRLNSFRHRGRRGGVGRRDDRAERDRGGEREPGEAPAEKCNRRGGQHDREYRERDHRYHVAPQLLGRGVERRVEQSRSHEQRQGEVRLDADIGCERQEGDTGAGDGQQRGVRHAQALGRSGQHHGCEQENQNPFEKNHDRLSLR